MKRIGPLTSSVALAFLAFAACHSKVKSPVPAAEAKPTITQEQAVDSTPNTTAGVLSAAQNSLKSGNVEEAAARLAQLQLQRASFNAQQAKDYRQALSDAYDRALDAAQRGDPRGQAAIQLLRAAGPR